MVILLEFFRHVVRNLANSMKGSISNLGVGVHAVLAQNWNHHGDLGWFVNILTYLAECHDSGMFVAPVRVIRDSV